MVIIRLLNLVIKIGFIFCISLSLLHCTSNSFLFCFEKVLICVELEEELVELKSYIHTKKLHTAVYSSFIHNWEYLKATNLSFSR